MSKQIILKCDVCHKIEGVDLKRSDFVTEPLQLELNDMDNKPLNVSCMLNIQPVDNSTNLIVDNVVNDYDPTSYIKDTTYVDDNNLNIMMMETQMDKLMGIPRLPTSPSGDICKTCFKGMIRLLTDYAKFNEIVKF